MRSANTNFLDYPNNGSFNQFNYGVAGRAEGQAHGAMEGLCPGWGGWDQGASAGDRPSAPIIPSALRDGQLVTATDIMYGDQNGLNFYGEFVDRYTTHNFGYYTQSPSGANITAGNAAVAKHASNEFSILGEAGYIINQHLEPFARYEFMHLVGTPAGSKNDINVITAGFNYFFYGHRLKVTPQVMWLPQGIPFDDGPSDELANPTGKTELDFEVQLQFLI